VLHVYKTCCINLPYSFVICDAAFLKGNREMGGRGQHLRSYLKELLVVRNRLVNNWNTFVRLLLTAHIGISG